MLVSGQDEKDKRMQIKSGGEPLGKLRWVNNIQIDFKERGCEDQRWMELVQHCV
jgi:hypothetical protein